MFLVLTLKVVRIFTRTLGAATRDGRRSRANAGDPPAIAGADIWLSDIRKSFKYWLPMS